MNFTSRKAEPAPKTAKQYPPVTDYMAKDLITFKPNMDIREAMQIMLEKRISGAPVLDDHHNLVGMLSEKDCLHVIIESNYDNYPVSGMVRDYMSRSITTIPADTDVLDVANMFLNSQYRRYPVVHNGKLIGQISRRDVMRAAWDLKATTW